MAHTVKQSKHQGKPIPVYLEVGTKRVFACALDWPGWCRGGRDEGAALQSLLEYGPRYAKVVNASGLRFHEPEGTSAESAFTVVERVQGNTTTDFGAPDAAPSVDNEPVDAAQLLKLQNILKACWAAFESAVRDAKGKELKKGPRGGGRNLEVIIQHVYGAQASYLTSLGGKLPSRKGTGKDGDEGEVREDYKGNEDDPIEVLKQESKHQHQAILEALESAAHGEIPKVGPRGGVRWTPRYFVRRAAWHILDHVWEIEDRVV